MSTLTAERPAVSRIRYVVGYAAILGTLPYLVLKAMWLFGSTIGITDPKFADDESLFVLNTITAGMELVAIVIALAFTHSWGQRLPAGLVLLPMWVGTGFLVPTVLAMPLAGVASMANGGGSGGGSRGGLPLEPWLQPLVYGGFAWQGIWLCVAFVLYAWVRWRRVLTGDGPRGVVSQGVRGLGQGAVAVAFVVAAGHLAIALGLRELSLSDQLMTGMHGVIAAAAGGGLLALLHGRGSRVWVPLALVWAGTSAMFCWGGWTVLNTLGGTFLSTGGGSMLDSALDFAKFIAGPLMALITLRLVTPQRADR